MEAPLISMITPCYNSGSYIHRLLDSIFAQDYPAVEMYAVDDGSTDNTRQVIQTYIPLFEQRGYSLTYVYQEHAGQSEAINKGLKYVKGKYLVWPDSDDYYADVRTLSLLAGELERSDETVSMIRCLPIYVDESGTPWNGYRLANFDKEDLFEDCLFGNNGFWYLSGGYMVKMELVDAYIPQRTISAAKNAGQNWQLMLPLLYQYRCLTIQQRLYTVVIRTSSHSREQYKTYADLLQKNKDFEYVLAQTLSRMEQLPDEQKVNYIKQIRQIYKKKYIELWLQAHPYLWKLKCLVSKILHRMYDQIRK